MTEKPGAANFSSGMAALNQERLAQALGFFLYGALVHLLLLTRSIHRGYPPGSDVRWIHHWLTYVVVAVAGGLAVTWLMLRLLRRVLHLEKVQPLSVLLWAGLFGICATGLAAAGSSIVASVVLTQRASRGAMHPLLVFLFAVLPIGTYALGAVLGSAPLAFLAGLPPGGYILWLRRRLQFQPRPTAQAAGNARLSLALGVLSLLLILIPVIGLALGILAVFYGVKTLRQVKGKPPAGKSGASTGIALGAVCIAFWIYSFGVYIAASYGWLPRR